MRTVEVEIEIDEAGEIHPLDPSEKLPQGRAILIWSEEPLNPALISEKSLEDWLSSEENAAWAYLQPGNS